MLTEKEAQDLMIKLIKLRKKVKNDPSLTEELKNHEKLCVEKFSYLVSMRTGRYKSFNNYEDLNQEGFEALLRGMKNYNPKKGSAFWWFHRYIGTRIARMANLHCTIRYPLKIAKEHAPHREFMFPLMIEDRFCPDKQVEQNCVIQVIQNNLKQLNKKQQEVLKLAYGFDGDKPMSVNRICKKLKLSRTHCLKIMDTAFEIMRDNIEF